MVKTLSSDDSEHAAVAIEPTLPDRPLWSLGSGDALIGPSFVLPTVRGSVLGPRLEDDLLRAIRAAPDSRLDDLAGAVGLPRSNFGRPLTRRLRQTVQQLLADGLVEEHSGRYRLSKPGRHVLAERASDSVR